MKTLFKISGLLSILVLCCLLAGSEVNGALLWSAITPLPNTLANHPSLAINGNLYAIGGSTSGLYSTVFRSGIDNSTGSISSWDTSTTMPRKIFWNSALNRNGFIYVLGGAEYPASLVNSLSNVVKGVINSSGGIYSWSELTPLPDRLSLGDAAVVGDWLVYSGGGTWTNGGAPVPKQIVYSAKLDSGGNIDSNGWQNAGTLPTPLMAHAMINTGKRLVFIGGGTNSGLTMTSQVFSYSLDSLGRLIDYKVLPSLPIPSRSAMIQKIGNYVVMAGGYNSTDGFTNKVYYSELNLSGDTTSWQLSPSALPGVNCCTGSAVWNNRFYITGGHNGGYLNSVWMANLSDIVPVPTPTPDLNTPIIIIPGIAASWNHNAILRGEDETNDKWTLAPYINLYDGLISSLKKVGYVEGNNLFVYAYDWRKPIKETASQLETFINQKILVNNPVQKIRIIGHSMGGLVARTYAQQTNNRNVDTIVMVGSPHRGAVKTYKIWEGADFSDYEIWQSYLIRLYLTTHRKSYTQSYVDEVMELVPSLRDLLPTFDYLKTADGKIISENKLTQRNTFLPVLNQFNYTDLSSKWRIVQGTGLETLRFLAVEPRNALDSLLGFWADGHPNGKFESESGDKTVLLSSGNLGGVNVHVLDSMEHGQLISKRDGQNEIFGLLGLPAVGSTTEQKYNDKVLIIAIASPLNIELFDPDGVSLGTTSDGLLMVDDPKDGIYKLKVNVTGSGRYNLYFGRLDRKRESWDKITGILNKKRTVEEFTFNVNFSEPDLGSSAITKAINRVKELVVEIQLSGLPTGRINSWGARLNSLITDIQKSSGFDQKIGLVWKRMEKLEIRADEAFISAGLAEVRQLLGQGYLNRQ